MKRTKDAGGRAEERPPDTLPEAIREEIVRLWKAGFSLLPLGGAADGKKPTITGWAYKRPTLGQVFGPMNRKAMPMFGIRLDGLAVLDCDINDPDLVADLEARFGASSVHVRTPRGQHLYYKLDSKVPNLRGEGLPVDVKAGRRAYVVGPLSKRPDGGIYAPMRGVLGVDALTPLHTSPSAGVASADAPASIAPGKRHNELIKHAIKDVAIVSSVPELVDRLKGIRDDLCEQPNTLPNSEIEAIAEWAWRCRLENRIYKGRRSGFSLHREPLELLRGQPAQEDALALYVRLVDQHGHIHGKPFPLCQKAMKSAGLTSLSRDRFLAARRTLERVGLLKQAGKPVAGARKQTFQLARPTTTKPNGLGK